MSFTLLDLGSENYEFNANIWHWKAALEIIKSFDLLSSGQIRQMEYNATGVRIELEDAHLVGEKIQTQYLPKLAPNQRVLMDLSITDAPDDGTLYKNEDEQWKNYSVNGEWLKDFSDFCLKSKGFQVF